MPRFPRILNPEFGDLVEITTRTIQGRLLLRPSAELNEVILGVLGRAMTLGLDIGLCGFTFLSNHYVMLVRAPSQRDLSAFVGYLNGNLAKEVARLHDWHEKVWGRRYSGIQVVDENSAEGRLKYVLAHGAKEGLVERPSDWPGVTCLPSLLRGQTQHGVWFDRSAEYRARKGGKAHDRYEFATSYDVPLVPLPGWEDLEQHEIQARCGEILSEVEEEARRKNISSGRTPPGPQWILDQHPHDKPLNVERSPAPLCHASKKETRQAYRKRHRELVRGFKEAAQSMATMDVDSWGFPPGTFPPAPPYVPQLEESRTKPVVSPYAMPP